jgi:hypothetical protein
VVVDDARGGLRVRVDDVVGRAVLEPQRLGGVMVEREVDAGDVAIAVGIGRSGRT